MQEEIIKICKNCHGVEPCHCDNKEYIKVIKWIYDLMKSLKPL